MNFSERGANIDEMKMKRKRQKRKKQKQKYPVLLDHVQPGDALQPNLYSLITKKRRWEQCRVCQGTNFFLDHNTSNSLTQAAKKPTQTINKTLRGHFIKQISRTKFRLD